MQEKLYSMKKELAALLSRDRLLKSAVKEVNKQDMIKASMVIRNAHHEEIDIEKILGGDLQKDLALGDYVYIENFTRLVKVADNCLDMGKIISTSIFSSVHTGRWRTIPMDTSARPIRWCIPLITFRLMRWISRRSWMTPCGGCTGRRPGTTWYSRPCTSTTS
mgnify:CR=1 FL=1